MKISKSKKELARIISENGGWLCADFAAQQDDGEVWFSSKKPEWNAGCGIFSMAYEGHFTIGTLIRNRHQCILSREEYFHLYPAPDADGWIECNGISPEIGSDVVVDVKFMDGGNCCAGVHRVIDWRWTRTGMGSDIIAYRLHNPEQQKHEFCESVTRSIPEHEDKPTIEQLAADYRNRKDYADRKQQEAYAAKADAEDKLAELVAAGKALNLVISFAEEEPELVVTDWLDLRVGDEMECVEPAGGSVVAGSVGTIIGVNGSMAHLDFPEQKSYIYQKGHFDRGDVKFIRLP